MRALVLAPYRPFPVRHGGHLRAWGLVRGLARFAAIRVLAIGNRDDPDLGAAREALASLGAELEVFPATGPGPEEREPLDIDRNPDALAHFRSPALEAALPGVLADFRPDAVHLEELVMGQYLPALPGPRVLDRQKVEAVYHEDLARLGRADAAWHRAEAVRFRRFEERLAGGVDAVLVTARDDADALGGAYPAERVHVLPNGVDERLTRPLDRTRNVDYVLLYGSLDYPPNADALAGYFRDVWPLLRESLPALRTLVVGSGTAPPELPRDDARVEVRGFLAEPASVLTGPGVLVVPLRVGGGVRNKILEALACGMPVVSTRVGAAGLGLVPGQDHLEAEKPEAVLAAVLRLAREPETVARLGTAGHETVTARFRWPEAWRRLEALYRELLPAARGRGRSRILLVGVHPGPDDPDARHLSFPGHRTAQLARALVRSGCRVERVLLDEEVARERPAGEAVRVLPAALFRAGVALRQALEDFAPDAVVAAGGFHAARAVAGIAGAAPCWIDLPGDLAAEGQLRARGGGDPTDHVSVLAGALAAGDRFSVVGPSQRLALLGQLGLAGRLAGSHVAEDPVAVIPLASDGPAEVPALPEQGFQVLSAGSSNTWMDLSGLHAALAGALAARPEMTFVSTGGEVSGHDETSHGELWRRIGSSPFAPRCRDRGRLPRREALEVLGRSHVVLCLSRRCLEAELGSRMRVVEALAWGRPVVISDGGDLAAEVRAAGAGLVVPAEDGAAAAAALVTLAADRDRRLGCARRARELWERRFRADGALPALEEWARRPTRWPRPAWTAVPEAETRLGLQRELDLVRGSRTFRLLRLLDRILGRATR